MWLGSGVIAMRDQRLRCLGALAGIVRRQRPLVKLAEYLQKEKEFEAPAPDTERMGSPR